MSLIAIFILFIIGILPILWLISEFKTNKRWIRISLGITSILCVWGVGFLAAQLVRLSYNSYYNNAVDKLFDTTISKLENGQTDIVISNLKNFKKDFYPTYESKANFAELAERTTNDIKNNKKPINP